MKERIKKNRGNHDTHYIMAGFASRPSPNLLPVFSPYVSLFTLNIMIIYRGEGIRVNCKNVILILLNFTSPHWPDPSVCRQGCQNLPPFSCSKKIELAPYIQGVFSTGTPLKITSFFSVSKMFPTFELVTP